MVKGDFERFQYLNVESISLQKLKPFFKELEYRFLFESAAIDKATFPHETALSKVNNKTNRIRSTKYTYHEELLPLIAVFFFENLISV